MKVKYVIFVFRKDGSAAGQTNQDKHDKAEMAFKLYDKVKVIRRKQIQSVYFYWLNYSHSSIVHLNIL